MIKIVEYSPQSIVIVGDTFAIKDKIKELGGSFSKSLTVEGNKVPGWVFPRTKKEEIEAFIQALPAQVQSKVTHVSSENNIKAPISIDPKITHEMFANLLNKYEMLEARVEYLEGALLKDGPVSSVVNTKKPVKKEVKSSRVVEEEEEEEEEKYTLSSVGKQKRLLD